ncbi:MAG: Lrp/AsnC family transcriptional regulator [Burkholderia sp.]|jgi:DNA-binding Lrp family transcriptional regulator|uniref:AsnC family transcriptional regulator n=1 Tax=Burkholderia arboris TaxID=488730 RepID=A0A9Q9UQK5_9BURK|nr:MULTISPECIES: Lrp/AsnC family transcriptional regulator [Burkholderia]ALX15979.1 AsnC family transcriptional regulator [Burkholderia cepacia JBK9]MBY8609856.1 Lrp/AsnC family transcriptional regulator [Burkholderia arboris]MCA3776442.1 Lrp/AsnC family transcriptional regulator [Burkholderia sp.]MCA3788610.1 Lrp/AsnC family transcriptional regulator [Burkholderia sp.]MCA3796428.1 Lrp/AsnC family transcriptional regulator [Burkholderia sp.]
MPEPVLDRIDRHLLSILQENGRASNLDLAKAVGLSPAQTLRRHRRLEEIGAIRRYETRLCPDTLGFGVTAFVHVTMERGHIRDLSKFQKLVSELAQIQECFSVTGDIDYVLKVVAHDLKGLSRFLLETLMRIPGVNGVHSSVCLDEIKCTSAMPVES